MIHAMTWMNLKIIILRERQKWVYTIWCDLYKIFNIYSHIKHISSSWKWVVEGQWKERWALGITKDQKKTFGDDKYVNYFNCGNDFTCVNIHQNSPFVYNKYVQLIVYQLYSYKAVIKNKTPCYFWKKNGIK